MKKYLILLLALIPFLGCSDDVSGIKGTTSSFDDYKALVKSTWVVQKISVKHGTHNPLDIVPYLQLEEISSGNKLVGEIKFSPNGQIQLINASGEFYFNDLSNMTWKYKDKFIRFMHSFGGFGYKIIWMGERQMIWYVQGTGIECGSKTVTVIEFVAKM